MGIFSSGAAYCAVSITASSVSTPRRCVTLAFVLFSPLYVDGDCTSIASFRAGPDGPSFKVDTCVLEISFCTVGPAIISVR